MADSSRASQLARSKSVRPRYKIICYIVAWLVALFATNPDGGLWALAWMFPLGLAAFINPHWTNSGGWGVFGACIGVYLVHAYFFFRSRSLLSTLFLLGVVITLLTCNVSGCRAMINTR
jgi:hypothetical protein